MSDAATEDSELLRRYAEEKSEAAFAELVRRHLDVVYAVALRRVGRDAHLAEDVAQRVFTALARNAAALRGRRALIAWLYTTARFASAELVRGERRRHAREQEAHTMQELSSSDPAANTEWERLRPVLDDALDELDERDREALLLRFFEGRAFGDIGARLRLTENAARMRVERALDKMHAVLARRGVTSTTAALATVLGHQAAVATPAGLAASVMSAAFAGGTVIAGTTAVVGSGTAAATFMSMTKLQLGLSGALVMAGAAGFVAQAGTNAQLREEIAGLRQENRAGAALAAENAQLARTIAEAADLRRDDTEFGRLQGEADALRTRLQQLARAEEARAAASREAFALSQLDRQPVARFQARPQYPMELRNIGVGGTVLVDFIVDEKGEVRNARALRLSQAESSATVVALSPFTVAGSTTLGTGEAQPAETSDDSARRALEAAAVEAVSTWKFTPGQKRGRQVNTRMQVPIVFTLNRDPATGTPASK